MRMEELYRQLMTSQIGMNLGRALIEHDRIRIEISL